MKDKLEISVFETIGSQLCVASSDGQKIFERLNSAFEQDREVQLSFSNVTMLTSAFLNAAIGQLYGKFDEKKIKKLLNAENIDDDDKVLLKRVVDTAKLYFKDPRRFDNAYYEEIENHNDSN